MTNNLPASLILSETAIADQIQEYKYLHQNPELSHREYKTADYIEQQLAEMPLAPGVDRQVHRIGETGVVGVLSRGEGATVAFRADIDGLPITEKSGRDYASQATAEYEGATSGVMHGCGHDTHIAAALGAARLFAASEAWEGQLVFIMQPAEEVATGADALLEAGLWEKVPHPVVLFGQHVFPLPAGHFEVSAGEFLSAADSWDVTVRGVGGHGSQPEVTVDPIVLGAAMITRLQTVVSREVSPLDSAVVSVGVFQGGLKNNIIPDSARFTLNIRTFSPETRERVLTAVERIIRGEAMTAGAPEPIIETQAGFPATINDADATARVQRVLASTFGAEKIFADDTQRRMGSEDFSKLATALGIPYVFWGFGGYDYTRIDDPASLPGNHSPFFAPDPEITLASGTHAAVAVLLDALEHYKAPRQG
ncbi:amidohydrolase [Rothia sp. 88186D007BW]